MKFSSGGSVTMALYMGFTFLRLFVVYVSNAVNVLLCTFVGLMQKLGSCQKATTNINHWTRLVSFNSQSLSTVFHLRFYCCCLIFGLFVSAYICRIRFDSIFQGTEKSVSHIMKSTSSVQFLIFAKTIRYASGKFKEFVGFFFDFSP